MKKLEINLPSENILPIDGEAFLFTDIFSADECELFFSTLMSEVCWRHEPIIIFGKKIMQPRLTAWVGDPEKSYKYSGITMQPQAWSPAILKIKQRIEPVAGVTFTSALLNLYRNENDSMGWHQDNEKELGKDPVIGSVSLGESRQFHFRHAKDKSMKQSITLLDGSFLLMQGQTQHFWYHAIPKTKKPKKPRINITFRTLK